VTHHNALGRDLYLRIATELHLKRMVVRTNVGRLSSFYTSHSLEIVRIIEKSIILWYESYKT
jgi:lysyl-tRNA synthetase class 2